MAPLPQTYREFLIVPGTTLITVMVVREEFYKLFRRSRDVPGQLCGGEGGVSTPEGSQEIIYVRRIERWGRRSGRFELQFAT